jgi:hypothetical protein
MIAFSDMRESAHAIDDERTRPVHSTLARPIQFIGDGRALSRLQIYLNNYSNFNVK